MIGVHEMRLHPEPFEKIRQGRKSIEVRLNDEKRKEIKVGDHLIFSLRPDFVEKVEVEVIELLNAPTFKEIFTIRPLVEFGADTTEDTEGYYQYYSKEEEQKRGVVAILFKLL